MKIRILVALIASFFLSAMLYGCAGFFGGGAVDMSSQEPVDPDDPDVEEAVLPCRAKEVIPADVHLAMILRNVADYEADVPETILAKKNAFWQALMNAPLSPEAGEEYTPTTSTLAGIVTEVLETIARQKLGTGFESAACIGLSVVSEDNELLSWGAEEGDREGTFPEYIMEKFGLSGEDPLAHIQFAWDDMPSSIEETLRFFEDEFLPLIPVGGDNYYSFEEITSEKVAEDDDYMALAGLARDGDEHSTCWALMMRNPEARALDQSLPPGMQPLMAPGEEDDSGDTEDTPFMFLCQHDMDPEGQNRFWFGAGLASAGSIAAVEEMLANARIYMESTSKVTYNEGSYRWGSEFNTNLAAAMAEVEGFDPDIELYMDLVKLRKQVPTEIQNYSLFKTDPAHASLGFGISLDEQAMAAIVAQFQATPDGVDGYKDMIMSGNIDLENLASGLDIAGMKIPMGAREISFSSFANILVLMGDKLGQWTP